MHSRECICIYPDDPARAEYTQTHVSFYFLPPPLFEADKSPTKPPKDRCKSLTQNYARILNILRGWLTG